MPIFVIIVDHSTTHVNFLQPGIDETFYHSCNKEKPPLRPISG